MQTPRGELIFKYLHADWLLYAYGNRSEPVKSVGLCAVYDTKEIFLQGLGHRTDLAFADGDLVDGANGGDLGRSAGEEQFVGDVKHFARNHLLDNRDTLVFGDAQYGITRDSGQHRVAQRRGVELALAYQENIFTRA